ncbi:MAG: DUF3466 family protein [Armatimonadetes bacterium]|nr:DUF3466 family protein [Armatimonadota bacterium]
MAALSVVCAQASTPRYSVYALDPGNGGIAYPKAISPQGAVVGQINLPDATARAFIFQDSGFSLLPLFGDATAPQIATANAVSSDGWIVGAQSLSDAPGAEIRAMVWTPEGVSEIPPMDSSQIQSEAVGISEDHAIAGTAVVIDGSFYTTSGFVSKSPTQISRLGYFDADLSFHFGFNSVFGMSSTGLVVGTASKLYDQWLLGTAYCYDEDQLQTLGRLDIVYGILGNSQAQAVNNNGVAAGALTSFYRYFEDLPYTTSHLARYQNGIPQDLGTLVRDGEPDEAAIAWAINNDGTIVGQSGKTDRYLRNESSAVIVDGDTIVDLNSKIDDPNWHLVDARAINDSGWIVGSGDYLGQPTGFLLKPEPCVVQFPVSLDGFVGDPTKLEVKATVSQSGRELETLQASVDEFGICSLPIPRWGEFGLTLRTPTSLWKSLGSVHLESETLVLAGVDLINGDVDGDNSVTIFDYVALSEAFDSIDGDPNFQPNADLDGDGAVTVFDYLILSSSFDSIGD